ncbi:MAG: hypothetical protein NC313_10345 [Butyrivibrio sp.]|nr:hypothetical protein [Butyrivibrio sp.]
MELEKRKEYLLFTLIFCCIGFVLYGGMAAAGRESLNIPWNTALTILIYGFSGAVLLGGLVSGIILFANFFKRQQLFFKIIMCIFFPITMSLICVLGILSLIPYEIYNFLCMRKETAA